MSLTPERFYHETTRKMVVLFGTLFNNITIAKPDGTEVKVPLTYSSKQKWYEKMIQRITHTLKHEGDEIQQDTEAITFPRLAYILQSFNYDSARKVSSRNNIVQLNRKDKTVHKRVFAPVPYNLSFELYLISRTMHDGLQVLEQILPFFTPRLSVTFDEIPEIGLERDVEVVLNGVQFTPDFEGDFQGITTYSWTLSFTVEANFFGPIRNQKIIRKVVVTPMTAPDDRDMVRSQIHTPDPEDAFYNEEWEHAVKTAKVEWEEKIT